MPKSVSKLEAAILYSYVKIVISRQRIVSGGVNSPTKPVS